MGFRVWGVWRYGLGCTVGLVRDVGIQVFFPCGASGSVITFLYSHYYSYTYEMNMTIVRVEGVLGFRA